MLSAASAGQALSLRRTLPAPDKAPGYWPALAELQSSYREVMEKGSAGAGEIAALRRRLIEIQAGGQFSGQPRSWRPNPAEVTRWQGGLSSDALLAYHVSGRSSFLWPVTADSVDLCALPGRETLARLTRNFRAELQQGVTGGRRDGPYPTWFWVACRRRCWPGGAGGSSRTALCSTFLLPRYRCRHRTTGVW